MEPNFRVGQYVLEKPLGEGGMGEVWLARNLHLGNEAAIKFLNRAYAGVEEIEQRFLNEGRRQASLSHPNIVKVYGFEYVDGHSFLILQYVDGESLERLLGRVGRLEPSEAARIVISILNGLGYAHDRNMVHRDIKPSNILIDSNGFPYIGDFGIVLALNEKRITRTGTTMGTALYMSPEHITKTSAVDRRSDIYSLGCVMYEMLSGDPPFNPTSTGDGDTDFAIKLAHLQQPPPALRQRNPALSPEIEAVVLRCLAKNPDDRFHTCREVRDALSAAIVGAPFVMSARATNVEVVAPPQRAATVIEPPRPIQPYAAPTPIPFVAANAVSPLAQHVRSRRLIATAAILMQIFLGGFWTYVALFNGPDAAMVFHLSDTARLLFTVLPAVFWAMGGLIGGFLQDRFGPRKIASIAGLLYGIGMAIALAASASAEGLFGVSIGALGVGMGYICSLVMVAKWFPDRRGLMTGLVVASVTILSVIVTTMRFSVSGAPPTLGVVLAILATVAAQCYANPPRDWRMGGAQLQTAPTDSFRIGRAVSTGRFWLLWSMLFLIAFAGYLAQTLAYSYRFRSYGNPTIPVSLLVIPVAGCILWAWLSDWIGRAKVYILLYAILALSCLTFLAAGSYGPTTIELAMAAIVMCTIAGTGTMPSFVADLFGTESLGAIYGAVLFASSTARVVAMNILPQRGGYPKEFFLAIAIAAAIAIILPIRARRYEIQR